MEEDEHHLIAKSIDQERRQHAKAATVDRQQQREEHAAYRDQLPYVQVECARL